MADDVEGFKTKQYPDKTTGKDVPLYVCRKCTPDFDTFDADDARAHTANGIHNTIGEPVQVYPTGQEVPK
jgi:hypothetical protein